LGSQLLCYYFGGNTQLFSLDYMLSIHLSHCFNSNFSPFMFLIVLCVNYGVWIMVSWRLIIKNLQWSHTHLNFVVLWIFMKLDYERKGREWSRMGRSSTGDWNRNVETIVHWSPFSSEADLLRQVFTVDEV